MLWCVVRALLALVTTGGLVATMLIVLSTSADAAPASAYRDTSADEARTIPAYLGSSNPHRVVRVFSVKFWARAGERRYITSQVVARQPGSTPDSLLMASVSITCSPDNGAVINAGATENIMRGTTSVFSPRFVYDVPRTGMTACLLVASGLRPRPSAWGSASRNVWFVDSGSFLSVSEPMASWTQTVETSARSRVLDGSEHWTPIALVASVHAHHDFEVTSDHKITTCSAVGGSRDSTTLGRELCSSRVSTQGTVVRLVVSATQLDRRGAACAAPQVFSRLRRVSADVHHAMVVSKSLVKVSHAKACRSEFAIRGSLVHVGGADVVVHGPSERTSILGH